MELIVEQRPKGAIRLPVKSGSVLLKEPGAAALACVLKEINDSECLCTTCFEAADLENSRTWQHRLTRGRVFNVELSILPHLPSLRLQAQVEDICPEEESVCLNLRFLQMGRDERASLSNAVLALAASKLSHAPEPLFMLPKSNDPYRGLRLGHVLVALGRMTQQQADEAERAAKKCNERLGRYLLRRGMITSMELCGALSLQCGLHIVDLEGRLAPTGLTARFSYLTMLKHQFIPYEDNGQSISIAASRALAVPVLKELEQKAGKKIVVCIAEEELIAKQLYAIHPDRARRHRKGTRYSLHAPVSFQIGDRRLQAFTGERIEGRTGDVSEAGLCVLTEHGLAKNAALKISFTLERRSVEGVYVVRYSQGLKDQPWFKSGLELVDAAPETASALKEICIQLGLFSMKGRARHKFEA